jgi:hypothetical protein
MPFGDLTTAGMRSPLRVRNNENNVTVFTKQVNGDPLKVIFGAAGTATAEQRVPLALAEDIDFLNALEQGVLTVISGPPEVVAALQSEADLARAERQRQQEASALSMVDRAQDKDMLGVTCIGPASTGRSGHCGRPLIMSAKQSGSVPPLCPEHESLAPTFHLVETGSKGEEASGASESSAGIVRREWKQAVMTAPQKSSE